MLLPAVETCPPYGGDIFCHTVVWEENSSPLFGDVSFAELSVNGVSTVGRLLFYDNIFKRDAILPRMLYVLMQLSLMSGRKTDEI